MLEKICKYARENKLSDIHIHSDEPIAIRVSGLMYQQEHDVIAKADIHQFIQEVTTDEQKAHFHEHKDLDMAIAHEDMRFRVNVYTTSNGPAMVLRKIEMNIPNLEELGLPSAVVEAANHENGLVLVTGPTGSGKSTTLAALINKINEEKHGNIITVEDPIEFVHKSKNCMMSQREVGQDAKSFASALKAMLREDPDVILVGELRDLETISLALTAAETGHLVFATLHTSGAPNTINRILDVFPAEQQGQARSQLSQSLRLAVTQTLLPRPENAGRIAAFEIMVNNTAVANLIRENKIFQIHQAMETGKAHGMVTMDDYVKQLMMEGKIDVEAVNSERIHIA